MSTQSRFTTLRLRNNMREIRRNPDAGHMVLSTPEQIRLYRLFALRSALKLEIMGLKHRGVNVARIVTKEFGFKGNKKQILEQLDDFIQVIKDDIDAKRDVIGGGDTKTMSNPNGLRRNPRPRARREARTMTSESAYHTWEEWKRAAKNAGALYIDGDKYTAKALHATNNGVNTIGEWDGAKGYVEVTEFI